LKLWAQPAHRTRLRNFSRFLKSKHQQQKSAQMGGFCFTLFLGFLVWGTFFTSIAEFF